MGINEFLKTILVQLYLPKVLPGVCWQSASGKHTGIGFLNKSFLSLLTIVGTDHISGCIKSGLCLAEHLQVVLLKSYFVYNKIGKKDRFARISIQDHGIWTGT